MTQEVLLHAGERRVILGLIGLIFALAALYTGLIFKTIFDLAEFEKLSAKNTELSSAAGNLEFRYIEAKKSISLSRAGELGLTAAGEVQFVSRKVFTREARAR